MIFIFAQVMLKPFIIGLLDVLEYKFFNSEVYRIHNFPDIVPYMKPSSWAAFVSGFKCAWWIFWPLAPLFTVLRINPQVYLGISALEFFGCILYMFKNDPDPYANHRFFYSSFIGLEILAVVSKLMI
jgi:hypothetical protein